MSNAFAVNEFEGVWRIYCNVCRADMGTMTGETLRDALCWAIKRGGVKCLECRKKACENCGYIPENVELEDGLCWFCFWDVGGGKGDALVHVSSCLVNHKSRETRER